jgi:hypothetical protein
MTIRDNALWARHIEGDPRVAERILSLPQNAAITLLVDATPVRFRKMRDGADGRPTPGLRPADAGAKRFWDAMGAGSGRWRRPIGRPSRRAWCGSWADAKARAER